MDVIQLLFSFRGRVSRKPYWMFTIVSAVVVLLPVFTILKLGSEEADNFTTVMSLVLLWPALAIQAKRWHDRDKSAAWILINFIPLIGGLWALIENGFLEGTAGDNQYGEDPIIREREAT